MTLEQDIAAIAFFIAIALALGAAVGIIWERKGKS